MRNTGRNSLLWFSVLLLILFGLLHFLPVENNWVFVYYMSYDNDLSPFGRVILGDLQKGVINSEIAVTIQADFADIRGMKRIALYHSDGKARKKETALKSEDSADHIQLKKYLDWVRKKWKAKNYCIVFLNHGGTLNNMCQDMKPFKDSGKNKQFGSGKWLNAVQAGEVIKDFNQKVGGKVRLLFLQQCGRASIQNLYSFVDCAEYILASPVIVGAPNTYYTKTLSSVALDPNNTGEAIVESIMREDEHYTVYTLIDNDKLKKLPEKLKPVLDSLASVSSLYLPKGSSSIFEHGGEKFYDLKSYLQALSAANSNIAANELGDFLSWSENSLIVKKAIRETDPNNSSHCGLSIYIPMIGDPNNCYDSLSLYQKTNLGSVMKKCKK